MDFKLTPVSKNSVEWQCSILQIGGLTVLLNCGWTESLDTALLSPIMPYLQDIDLILLTHADMKHVGALPYLLSKYPVSCPVLCTEPVCRLGELSCIACLEDREKYRAPIDDFDVDDVLRVFMSRVTSLHYRETFHLHARGRSLSLCAFPAGGHLGSAFWTLHCGGCSVAYLLDFDMRRGRYLDGLDLLPLLPGACGATHRWDAVITSCPACPTSAPQHGSCQAPQEVYMTSKSLTVAKNVREQLLLEESIATLRRGGSVLIPADVAGWIPELLLLFEAAWSQDRQLSTNYPLVWLSSMGDMVLDQVKTRLEYMSGEVLKGFETRFGQNPFVLKNVRIFQTFEEVCAAHPLARPKVILTTSPHLEGGDSRELLMHLCGDPRTLLWLLGIPPAGTLARQLLDDFILKHATRKEYRLQQHLKQTLPEEELRAFYEAKLQELSESGQNGHMMPEFAAKADENQEDGTDCADSTKAVNKTPATKFSGASFEARTLAKVKAQELRNAAGTLLTPYGWPSSRTVHYSETRTEGDEYGHLLTTAELKSWRLQDQEGNKYSSNPIMSSDDADGGGTKEEATKADEEGIPPVPDEVTDLHDDLRIHFPEPMRCEVRDRTVRISCRVRFLPDSTQETRDVCALIRMVAPRHVVILPGGTDESTAPAIKKHFKHARLVDNVAAPEIHCMQADECPLKLNLVSNKRKVQVSAEVWQKLSFLKTSEGVRIARVHASPQETADPRIMQLGKPAEVSSNELDKSDQTDTIEDAQLTERKKMPRSGALFLGLGAESVTLSDLKEQLRIAEWTRDMVEVDFHAPRARIGRPWSARVLHADGKAFLGWARGKKKSENRSNRDQTREGAVTLRLEGVPGEELFSARAALYKRCALL